MWERLIKGFAGLGFSWAKRKIEDRERQEQADREESDRLHQETQRPVNPPPILEDSSGRN